MAAKIISVLAKKYGFDAEEATTYYNEHKSEAGSTTSMTTVQRAESAISKTQASIDEVKAKLPDKKGKSLENANAKLVKLEEKLAEQMKKLEEKKAKEAKPKKQTKAKAEKKPKEPKTDAEDKRIKRMSPTLTKHLTETFQQAGKEFKKDLGAKFAKYVNELAKDDYEAKKLEEHMRDFVDLQPAAEPVKEPEEVPDEDMTEVEFNGKTYVVGDISNRVYLADEENGDEFQGYLGMGKFKDMKRPE